MHFRDIRKTGANEKNHYIYESKLDKINIMKKLLIINFLLFSHIYVNSQIGFQDPGFGNNGILTTTISPKNDYGLRLCVLDDDSFILAGSATTVSGDRCFAMAKYSRDGELYTSFADGGIMTEDLGIGDDVINSAIVTEGGKILVTGRTHQIDYDIVFARYTATGLVDSSFGINGKVIIDYGFGDDRGVDIAIEDQNIIIGAFVTSYDSLKHFSVIKADLNGNPVPSFGNGGIVVADTGTENSFLTDMQIMDDGKILLVGYCDVEDTGNGDNWDIFMIRYNNDGTLDESFGTGGIKQASCLDLEDFPYSVSIQSGNKLIVCGSGDTNSDSYITLLRFLTNGDIDTTFGESGHVITSIGVYDDAEPSLVQPDNKIIIGGYTTEGPGNAYEFLVARYNPDGKLDSTFGTNGWTKSSNGPNTNQYGFTLAFQSNYDILLAGGTKENDGGFYDFMTVRYIGDHTLGLTDLNENNTLELNIFPNPATNLSYLNFTLTETDVLNVELIDLQGRMILQILKKQSFDKGKHNEPLNLSSLPPGNYILLLRGNKFMGNCLLVII
jgi:uncharacterized delta-60 repeat protein